MANAKGAALKVKEFFINLAKPLITALLIGIALFFFNLRDRVGQLETKVDLTLAHHGQDTAKLEAQISRDLARLEKSIDKLEARLTQRVALSSPNGDVRYTSMPPGYHEHEGKIVRVGTAELTWEESLGVGKAEYTFPVAPDAKVRIKGQEAKLEDLKAGMVVWMLHRNAAGIEFIATFEERTPRIGKLRGWKPDEVTVADSEGKEQKYKLAPGVAIKIGDRTAKPEELKDNPPIRYFVSDGIITRIEIVPPPAPS